MNGERGRGGGGVDEKEAGGHYCSSGGEVR